MSDLKVGDRIAYKAAFLRSICEYRAIYADRRGTVTGIDDWPLIAVVWDDDPTPTHVGEYNVLLADRIHLEPA